MASEDDRSERKRGPAQSTTQGKARCWVARGALTFGRGATKQRKIIIRTSQASYIRAKFSQDAQVVIFLFSFKEAHTVQQKIKELKQQEEQGFQKARQEKIINEMKQFKAKQKIEAQALEKKIATEKWELELSKTKEEA